VTTPSSRPDHEVLIIGTGFAGLGMAIALHKAGMHDFTLVEKEPDLGGTWLVNNYPGCACDVQSHMYSFSFEPNPRWSREFATQPEILAYLRACAEKHGLRPKIAFSTQAVGASYDAERALWRVELADAPQVAHAVKERGLEIGDYLDRNDPVRPEVRVVTARFVVGAMGGLSTPAYPKLPGLARFQGKTFHSQQWDHGYDLRGKRVAVIGTGASAIQFVPEVQRVAKELHVYQRSAAWVLPKPDRAISRVERALYAGVPGLRLLKRAGLYTRLEGRAVAFVVRPELLHVAEAAAHLYRRLSVPDTALRKKLTPDYSMGCKRVLMSNNWYSAVSQPNVDVVTGGIREVREHSIVDADGTERPVDAIIYGTGFRVADLVP
jgi:cation diffusion facilitator CzcD-associated flavoprotein CzcO